MPSLRFFDFVKNAFALQSTQTVVTGATGMGESGETIWLLGAATMTQFRWGAPFALLPMLQGWISIYNGSSFKSAVLGVEHMVSAITWSPSGDVWAATMENEIYRINTTGAILLEHVVPPYADQAGGVTLGLSSLQWWRGSLYAGSSLNGLLLTVSGSA